MAKRKFAGGNPFFSNKKYKGSMFGGRRVRAIPVFQKQGGGKGHGWVPMPKIDPNDPRQIIEPVRGPLPRRGLPNPKRKRKYPARISSAHNDLTVQSLGSARVGIQRPKRCSARPQYRNIEQKVLNGPSGVTQVAQGRQLIDILPSMMNGNWIQSAVDAGRYEWDKLPDSLYNFDEEVGTAAGVTSAVGRTIDRTRFHLKKISIDYGFLSMTTIPQLVDVYWVTPKYDHITNPIDLLNQMMLNNSNGQVASTSSNTVATTTATPGGGAKDNWGFNPWSLPEFRRAFKCLKKVKMTLNPGDQKHFRTTFHWNKTFRSEMANEGRNRISLKDITVWPIVILKCGLVGAKLSADVESKEVVFGSPKVGVVSNMLIETGLFPIGNRVNFQRIYKGMVEAVNTATDVLVEIDDNDAVNAPDKS